MGQVRKANFGLKPFLHLLIKALQTSLVFKRFSKYHFDIFLSNDQRMERPKAD